MSLFGSAAGAIAGAVGSWIGGGMQNSANSAASAQANAWNKENYQHRYQWAVEDMRKAGLNPILAATQGIAGNVNGASALAASNTMGQSVSAGMAAGASGTSASAAKQQANTAQSLANSQIKLNEANAANAVASATGQQQTNQFFMDTYSQRVQEYNLILSNLFKEGKRIDSETAKNLFDYTVVMPAEASLKFAQAAQANSSSALLNQQKMTEHWRTDEQQTRAYQRRAGAAPDSPSPLDYFGRVLGGATGSSYDGRTFHGNYSIHNPR